MMNCPICNGEMRIATEQVGVDSNNLPVFHRFAYCDVCRRKKDIDLSQNINNTNDTTDKTNQEIVSTEQTQTQQATSVSNNGQVTEDMKKQLAKKELHKIDADGGSTAYYILAGICALAFVVSFSMSGLEAWGVFFCSIGGFIFCLVEANKIKNRVSELKELSSGKKIVNICPRCKSQNIQMQMVQTGSTTTHGVSRVSNNINPLHPFTHTNVRKGNDYSNITYGNQCHCLDCGFVFSKPDVLYL